MEKDKCNHGCFDQCSFNVAEKEVLKMIDKCGGNVVQAAKKLGLEIPKEFRIIECPSAEAALLINMLPRKLLKKRSLEKGICNNCTEFKAA